jgi:hypothetical protein
MSQRYAGGYLNNINSPVTQVEYLVVAGGGGGGGQAGGGGGAGGLLTAVGYPVTAGTSITVTIGAGGGGGITTGASGSSSAFGNISTVGGGGGGSAAASGNGTNGGSSGGGYSPGIATAGQGNRGGEYTYWGASQYVYGGGGGAGSAGLNPAYVGGKTPVGCGGAGLVSTITGAPVNYAAGGSGTSRYGSVVVLGGSPNAGAGGCSRPGQTNWYGINSGPGLYGVANTGSGGGGGQGDTAVTPNQYGGTGGSGIVVIRYPSYMPIAASTTGSPEMTVTDAWRVYTFLQSGTITF